MIPIAVRTYENRDFPAVHRLEMEAGYELFPAAVFVRQMGVVSPSTFLVATLDEELIGYAIALSVQEDRTVSWILRMGVREDQRRNGVGSILLAEITEAHRARGVRKLRLTVSPWNVPALGLYLKAGFVQESYQEAYFGDDEDRIVMLKEIGEPADQNGRVTSNSIPGNP